MEAEAGTPRRKALSGGPPRSHAEGASREQADAPAAGTLSGRRRSPRFGLFRTPTSPWLRLAVSLALFEVAFLVAYWHGMSLADTAGSPFWSPDTVLLCTLLLTPPRSWWIYLLAAAPIRFLAVPVPIPAWFLTANLVNDSLKAILSATLLRRFLPNPIRFDRLRDFAIYVAVAVFGVPILSALGGAAAWTINGREFWPSWRSWFLGDAMAGLVLTPAVLYWLFGYRDRRREAESRRLVEGVLLTSGLALLGFAGFSGRLAGPYEIVIVLYAPVAFLIWAAIRFGVKGSSAVLTLAALLAAAAGARGALGEIPTEMRILWIQLFILVVGLPVLFLAVLVRERDRASAALRRSEERYREVVDAQPDLICRYLPDTTLTFVNEAYCRYFRRSPGELIGHRFLDLLPESGREAVRQHIASLVANPRVETWEHEVMRADGSTGWQQWVDYPILDGDRRVRELQAIGRDVTDRKGMDEESRKLAHAGRIALLGELTASIAHEINQPLGAILANADAAEMLLENGSGHLSDVRTILADIRRDDLRASEVIKQVRSLVRQRQMDLRPLDLPRLAAEVLRLAEPEARRRNVSIDLRFDSPLPEVRGDRVFLQQVFLNLALNAMEAMGELPAGQRRLTITAQRGADGQVEVAVVDCGHGIAPSLLPRLFDAFVTGRDDGMGLGLSISRSIVEAHGGRIQAENNPGGGATVRFTLPAAQAVRTIAPAGESS